MRTVLVSLVLCGCGFTSGKLAAQDGAVMGDGPSSDTDSAPGSDGNVSVDANVLMDIAHVSASDEAMIAPTADVMWSGSVTIDTGTRAVSPALPTGATIRTITLDDGTTQATILEVRTLVSTATVRITGDKPLIIFASQSIDIQSGTLDIAARGVTPGAGARTSGVGLGQTGTHAGNYSDGGGGGGGFGTAGAVGGTATQSGNIGAGGAAGMVVGDVALATLLGGSPGGAGQPGTCNGGTRAAGGGGGGAIQLSAPALTLDGLVVAGGGGGVGGGLCTGNMASPGGGGSGGAIYIQTNVLTGAGSLAANGGGGGAGSNWNGGPGQNGQNGADALTLLAAQGGPTVAPDGGAGGAGATTAPPGVGESITSTYPNGGGGGGGAGRIYLAIPAALSVALTSSPAFSRAP